MFNEASVNSIIIKIVGGLAIALTFILFFMITDERVNVHWMGLVFLVVSQIFFFFGAPLVSQSKKAHNSTLLTSGTATVLVLYLGLTLILALTSGLFINAFTAFMVIQLTFIFVAIILVLVLYAFANKVNQDIEKRLAERERGDDDLVAKRGKF